VCLLQEHVPAPDRHIISRFHLKKHSAKLHVLDHNMPNIAIPRRKQEPCPARPYTASATGIVHEMNIKK
jgi:hypothetical protein